MQEFQFFRIFANNFCLWSFFGNSHLIFEVIPRDFFICICLIISYVEHFFIYLLAICMSFLLLSVGDNPKSLNLGDGAGPPCVEMGRSE